MMFFARPDIYEEAGLYGIGHLVLFLITIISIIIAIIYTKDKKEDEIRKIIRNTTIFIWILEIIKIIFNIVVGNKNNLNTYIPLYYCSIILYAGLFSGFGKGIIKHIGDVFIATGALIAGIIFLVYPNTSLISYPAFHYISIQSFILHGTMLYLGILVNITEYINIEIKDIIYYAGLTILISLIALIVNLIYDSNLMFISKDFPNSPIPFFYDLFGKHFSIGAITMQSILPFLTIFGVLKVKRIIIREKKMVII